MKTVRFSRFLQPTLGNVRHVLLVEFVSSLAPEVVPVIAYPEPAQQNKVEFPQDARKVLICEPGQACLGVEHSLELFGADEIVTDESVVRIDDRILDGGCQRACARFHEVSEVSRDRRVAVRVELRADGPILKEGSEPCRLVLQH